MASGRCRTIPAVTRSEEAALDALVTQLGAALAGLGEPAVRDHPAFSVDADWLPGQWCLTATRSGAVELRFTHEGEWIRVDVAGLDECLELHGTSPTSSPHSSRTSGEPHCAQGTPHAQRGRSGRALPPSVRHERMLRPSGRQA